MLKTIRVLLVLFFVAALIGAGVLFYVNYTRTDISKPTIVSDVDHLELSVTADKAELRKGLRAYDNVDGDITDRIMVRSLSQFTDPEQAEFRVPYIVFDNASNYTTYERTVRYTDYTHPRFHMSKPLVFNVGETVSFLDRISATDCIDGNITGRMVLTESNVSNNVPGSYRALISVTNRMGDAVSLPLTVLVVNQTAAAPKIVLKDYLIYVSVGDSPDYRSYLSSLNDPLDDSGSSIPLRNAKIASSGVDTSTPGVYDVYYYFTGLSGETATAILTVIVEE